MGFITNSIRRTLFDKESFASAIKASDGNSTNGYAVIKITPMKNRLWATGLDMAVIGIIQNGLTFVIDAEWAEIGDATGLAPDVPILGSLLAAGAGAAGFLNKFAGVAGGAEVGAVYASKRIYKKSGSLIINPTLKIVDWDGTGQPMTCAKIIASLLVPSSNFKDTALGKQIQPDKDKIQTTIKSTTSFAVEGVTTVGTILKDATTATIAVVDKNLASDTSNFIDSSIKTAGALLNNGIATAVEEADDLFTLRSSPTPVTVEIGNYFKKTDMVITNAQFTFSKECTKYGPLYVEIALTITSRYILRDIEAVGFNEKNMDISQVSFTGGF